MVIKERAVKGSLFYFILPMKFSMQLSGNARGGKRRGRGGEKLVNKLINKEKIIKNIKEYKRITIMK